MSAPKYSVMQVRPAKDSLIGRGAFVQFLSSLKSSLKAGFLDRLLGTYETITLELINISQTTFFVIACPERIDPIVRSQIAAQYPNALISDMEDYLPAWLNHGSPVFAQLKLQASSHLPINVTDEKDLDQLSSILGSLSRLSPGQAAIIQICLFSAPKNWQKSLRQTIEVGVSADPEKFKAHPQKAAIEEKLSVQAFATDIRLAAITPDYHESQKVISQIAAAFGTYSLPEGNGFTLKIPKGDNQYRLKHSILMRNAKYASQNQFLNYNEISAIFHLPGESLSSIKNISWGKTLKGEPPVGLPIDEGLSIQDAKEINFFAKTEYKNRMAHFGMRKGDDRRRHVYILGKSGTGKSTLIANMAINDIHHGEGIALVDPHGDTAERLLDYIPESRIDDVAYLDPSSTEKSFRLNPLYVKNPAYGELVASGIVSIFSKLYGNSWGPRLEYILRNTLLTLVAKPGATLLDVPRVLTNKKYREEYLAYVKDVVLLNFWHDEYDKYTEKFQSEAIAPILNKVGQFITSPTIRDIISHPTSTVDFEDMMNQGKIVILNLPQGKIGEDNAALLGAMFISQIQIAAMNRANMPEEERKDFFLYVDEFQNFATTSFIKILSEARKYRLNLILANQYTAQLPEEIRHAIFGNAGTLISFVVGADDASNLMAQFGSFYTQDDLVGLARHQVIVKMSVNSTISMPFPAYTLPLPKEKDGLRDRVEAASEEKYYRVVEPISNQIIEAISLPATGPLEEQPANYSPKLNPETYKNKVESVNNDEKVNEELPEAPMFSRLYQLPSLEQLDKDRQSGFRPSVVACVAHRQKVLFLFQSKHGLWQLPQGGVNNQEDIQSAFVRELSEQIGSGIANSAYSKGGIIYEDKIEFPPDKHSDGELKTDTGEPVRMVGKKYYFLFANFKSADVKVNTEEFSEYKWVDYDQAVELIKTNLSGGKLRTTNAVLSQLKTLRLITFETKPVNNQNNKSNHHDRSRDGRHGRPRPHHQSKPATQPTNPQS